MIRERQMVITKGNKGEVKTNNGNKGETLLRVNYYCLPSLI